jgi:tRNA(fMet)-specific endonuclease VapC
MRTLDTNICSYLLRRHPESVVARFSGIRADEIFLSSIVVAELRYGAEKLGSARFGSVLEEWLSAFTIQPWPEPASRIYAHLRADLERKGSPIGNMDLLIAAHALAEYAVLVSNNTREFERVPGLKLENWT